MAWQVLLVRLPDLGSFGAPDHVASRIGDVATRSHESLDCDCCGDRLVVLRNDDFVIEAELGGVAEVDRVLLNVLGSDAAIPLVSSLARALDASAIDCETDVVLDADAALPDTLRQWQDRIEELR